MIQSVQGRATLGLSTLVSGVGSKAQQPDAHVYVRVGKNQPNTAEIGPEKVKMPKAVLPFGKWPPGSEKVDERTGAIQEYKPVSVADQLAARSGGNEQAETSAAPSGGKEVQGEVTLQGEDAKSAEKDVKTDEARRNESSKSFTGAELSLEDVKRVKDMKKRDKEVQQHEQAHKAMGGAYTGAIRYEYEVGPDGKRYIVEGEVPVDLSAIRGSPGRTISKMKTVRSAAMSPSNPSVADIQVAMKATRIMQRAQQKVAVEQYQKVQELRANTSRSKLVQTSVDKTAANNDGSAVEEGPTTAPRSQAVQPSQGMPVSPPDFIVHNYSLENLVTLSTTDSMGIKATLQSSDEGSGRAVLHSPANDNIVAQMHASI